MLSCSCLPEVLQNHLKSRLEPSKKTMAVGHFKNKFNNLSGSEVATLTLRLMFWKLVTPMKSSETWTCQTNLEPRQQQWRRLTPPPAARPPALTVCVSVFPRFPGQPRRQRIAAAGRCRSLKRWASHRTTQGGPAGGRHQEGKIRKNWELKNLLKKTKKSFIL